MFVKKEGLTTAIVAALAPKAIELLIFAVVPEPKAMLLAPEVRDLYPSAIEFVAVAVVSALIPIETLLLPAAQASLPKATESKLACEFVPTATP